MISSSATPFFLRGSGYAEGTLFPWTMSDFSPYGRHRVRHCQAAPSARGRQHPWRRNAQVPKSLGTHREPHAKKKAAASPRSSTRSASRWNCKQPSRPSTATTKRPLPLWRDKHVHVPPCFIIVCNNTSTSKLVYDYVSGFYRESEDGRPVHWKMARLPLFRNFDDHWKPLGQAQHALDRQRATRVRGCAGHQFQEHGLRRDRTLPS